MTSRTRYFVIVSLMVLVVGLGTGIVAYYLGVPLQVFQAGGPDELRYVPRDATVVAYANVQDVMNSGLRQRIRRMALPGGENGQRQFQTETGINIETDIDRVVACLYPRPGNAGGTRGDTGGLVLARGRFDQVRIERLMRDHGAEVEEYKGKRLMSRKAPPPVDDGFALTFVEANLAAVGSIEMVRAAVDLTSGGTSVTSNDELMGQIRSLTSGNAWAVGRFDALRENARLPQAVSNQIPDITWFSLTSQIDSGIRGVVRADAKDEVAANNLRDVIRGFVALAKMQADKELKFKPVVESLQIGGTEKTVTLSFAVSGEVLDQLSPPSRQPQR